MRGGKKPGPVAVVVADHPSPAEGIYKAILLLKSYALVRTLYFLRALVF